jgi:peptidoglycan/LPS O-acetylase OafA/YrhL
MPDWRTRLTRVTSGSQYLPEIDGLRFLAIMPVVALHAASYVYLFRHQTRSLPRDWGEKSGSFFLWLVSTGWMGVPIFFVISGFILGLPFAQHRLAGGAEPSIRRYFLRRLTRIEPPYVVALTAYWIFGGFTASWLGHYAAGLAYVHVLVFGALNPVLVVSWTLEIEVVFYIMAPWLARLYGMGPSLVRQVGTGSAILLYGYLVPPKLIQSGMPRLANTLPAFIQYFAAGLLLADLYASGVIRRSKSYFWDAMGICGLCTIFALGGQEAWRYRWLGPASVALMMVAAFRGVWFNRFVRTPSVSIIGGMCYSIYLLHTGIIGTTGKIVFPMLPEGWSFEAMTAVALAIEAPLVLAVSAAFFVWVERPFMNGPGSRYLEKVLLLPYGFRAAAPAELAKKGMANG